MTKPKFDRQGGLLLHPSSLPGEFGIGSLGAHAREFVDAMEIAKIKIWQILPLGPTGFGDSPYQCFSTFAGNPYLIDISALIDLGLLDRSDIPEGNFPGDEVDYGSVIPFKMTVLRRAFGNFRNGTEHPLITDFKSFCDGNNYWLDDFALFMALKESHGGKSWLMWSNELRYRDPQVLIALQEELKEDVEFQMFIQFLFFEQWTGLKKYANSKGISIMGDIPLYVSLDSSEAWTNPGNFLFGDDIQPLAVAGVPPDYFSTTGQLWGNPIYNWQAMKNDGFRWWIKRVEANLRLFDLIRIDHFRGLEAYWSVPYGAETAVNGQWIKAPGMELFAALSQHFGELPLVAEDLGVITPEVDAMREAYGLPGMKILQFAFDSGEDNQYLPHSYGRNSVVYTGTHDNDTLVGWVATSKPADRRFMLEYLNSSGEEIHWDFIRLAWASVACLAIIPVQDVIGASSNARMNIPGTVGGNWKWRLKEGELTEKHLLRIAELSRIYCR